MKIGRNDPCPCGSGKKYKKCCLAKDEATARRTAASRVQEEAAARQAAAALASAQSPLTGIYDLPPVAQPSPDPHGEERDELWDDFEAADPAEQPAIFRRALAEPDLLDDELAYEMLNAIHGSGDGESFAALVDALRQQRPDLYEHDAHYYLDSLIGDALLAGNQAAVLALGTEFAVVAGKDLDIFYIVLDRLAYHGQTPLIAEMMGRAWPQVQVSSGKYVWGAVDEFVRRALDATLYAFIERVPDLSADDPQLSAALAAFGPVDQNRLAKQIGLLSGQANRSWSLDDFPFKSRSSRRSSDDNDNANDPAQQALDDLTVVFLGDLHRTAGVSLSKGDLARQAIARYILRRKDRALESDTGLLWGASQPKKNKKTPVTQRVPAHPLCPDRATLDRFLSGMLSFMSPHSYEAAATLELVPAWLRFLEAQDLITAEPGAAVLQELRGLVAEASPIWGQLINGPQVGLNIQRAWERATD